MFLLSFHSNRMDINVLDGDEFDIFQFEFLFQEKKKENILLSLDSCNKYTLLERLISLN